MATKKNPTNSDIIAKLDIVTSTLLDHAKRIGKMENKWIAVEAAKQALEEYKQEHKDDTSNSSPTSNAWKAVLAALAAVTAALIAIR